MKVNAGYDYVARVESRDEGRTLLAYLSDRFRHSDEKTWAARILAGLVRVDGETARPERLLRAGQRVLWSRPGWTEPPAPRSFAVLFQDDDVLAVAKPAGLPTLPGGGFVESTLLARVRDYDPPASPLHRLGRWTSGVVLFARNREASASLSRQFKERSMEKRYRALAEGRTGVDAFEVTTPIGPVPHRILGHVHGASPSGRPSKTRVLVRERRARGFLCDVFLETGRPHQIRIHLAAAGHPLVGDPLYPPGGVPEPGARAVPGDPGYLLHAAEITFRHPGSGHRTTVACAPPPELRCREDR